MKVSILNMRVNILHLDKVIDNIKAWLNQSNREGRYICVSNVHMCMEVFDNNFYKSIVNSADLTVADGKPIYWAQLIKGHKDAQQIRGEDLTLALCKKAEEERLPIGFYGATEDTLEQLNKSICLLFPKINIVYSFAPPFRPVTQDEDIKIISEIKNSGVQILFVGLGCPKQEIWMAEHKSKVSCTMLGVGAAFDFISGNKKNAPSMLQKLGLEWLYRLLLEPRRLWKRYLKQNPRFVYYFILQILGKKYG